MTTVDTIGSKNRACRPRIKPLAWACQAACAALAAGITAPAALAGTFTLDNGVDGQWTLGASLGTNWRASDPDSALIGANNGGTANAGADDGELNYGKGDVFSTTGKIVGDLRLSGERMGLFVRAKAWYDREAEKGKVPHGSAANNYAAGSPLDDGGFDNLSKFSGIALQDAYVFGNFTLGERTPVNLKLGNQVLNWGESTFISGGINQYGAIDVPAARRPGAQVKEILLPIAQLAVGVGLAEGLSVEAFYQLKWTRTVLDGCGTYFSFGDIINCTEGSNDGTTFIAFDPLGGPDAMGWNGYPAFGGINGRMSLLADREPQDGGQFGVSAKVFAKALDTEFGVYAVNYHQNTPAFTFQRTPTSDPASVWNGAFPPPLTLPGLSARFDYSGEDIKVFGLSASTVMANWSFFGEVSRTTDFPVSLNGPDMVNAFFGAGPLASRLTGAPGELLVGYDRKDKTQLQITTLKAFPRVLGADTLTLLAELGFQHWSGIGDPATSVRYGRGGPYGSGPIAPGVCPGQVNPDYCENEGFATSSAWGYRVFVELSYANVFAGVNLKPRLFVSHDVDGYSADGVFSKGRWSVAPGIRAEYNNRYYVDFSINRFNHGAKYDFHHDRDFYSLVAGINF
ncbi:DUF1302 domain-containing protein [Piscinibacter sp.]|uniref:DUF1302 domain-containing protein n=1 Tax=Piscinibacter sp. TaxID=1903157 RepID=UPI002BD0E7B5|nr:DUF1302 domain-containing protein [Albitalea sp.]HUG20940.1 DUF1302 domain-containing protein [Albitalea sp.]